jgi:ABC-type multidrug transport system fused ATPase/permease subunit
MATSKVQGTGAAAAAVAGGGAVAGDAAGTPAAAAAAAAAAAVGEEGEGKADQGEGDGADYEASIVFDGSCQGAIDAGLIPQHEEPGGGDDGTVGEGEGGAAAAAAGEGGEGCGGGEGGAPAAGAGAAAGGNADAGALATAAKAKVGALADKAAVKAADKAENDKAGVKEGDGRLTDVEHINTGAVQGSVYGRYMRAAGRAFCVSALLLIGVQSALGVGISWWLGRWSEEIRRQGVALAADPATPAVETGYYLGVYGALSGGAMLASITSEMLAASLSCRASLRMHGSAFGAVLRAPLSFFDATPVGRVLNRFSTDMQAADTKLVRGLVRAANLLVLVLCICVVNVVAVPWLVFCLIPIVAIYGVVQRVYRASSRELKRLESVSLSPVYSHFAECMDGVATIRAYGRGASADANRECVRRLEVNSEAWMKNNVVNRWMGVRLDALGGLLVFGTGLACVLAVTAGAEKAKAVGAGAEALGSSGGGSNKTGGAVTMDAGIVGLLLSYAVVVTSQLNWGVRSISEVEQHMTSVERILELGAVKAEAWGALEGGGGTPGAPAAAAGKGTAVAVAASKTAGRLVFDDVKLKYQPHLPLVLKGVSFDVASGTRLGICGRTGSGKSTVALAIMRLVEVQLREGSQPGAPGGAGQIRLDGVDTRTLGLQQLRRAVAMVLQDPVLFAGTIRYNIDPAGRFSDAELLEVLRQTTLGPTLEQLGGLSATISEGGTDVSAGQRQLFCVARALLEKPTLLVMDEATSALDRGSDKAIQAVFKERLQGVTIVTIAHRIETLLDSDLVCVMDDGRVAEYGMPAELTKTPNGMFATLLAEARRVGQQKNVDQKQE